MRVFLEGDPSKMLSDVNVLDEAVMNKLKTKTHRRGVSALKYYKKQQLRAIWNSHPD